MIPLKGRIMYKLIVTSVTFFGAWSIISSGFHIFRSMSEMKENNFQLVYPMYPMQYYKLVTPKLVLLLVLTIHIKNTKPLKIVVIGTYFYYLHLIWKAVDTKNVMIDIYYQAVKAKIISVNLYDVGTLLKNYHSNW